MGIRTVPDGLYKPDEGETNWTEAVNTNWDIIQAKFNGFVGGGGGGSTWTYGNGAPDDGVGTDGDFYLRTDTNQVYQRQGGSYAVVATITGLPTDGSTSQVLRKLSNTDFDVEWHTPLHADLGGVGADDHHAKSHVHAGDGSGAVAHASLGSIGTDDHHAKSHAHDGADGSGAVPHSSTTGRTANDHHAQSHGHTGSDSSGTVAHSAVTGVTADQHHARSHNLRSSDHPDVSTTGTANDGDGFVYNAATGKWGPSALGAGQVGFVHLPDKGVNTQYVDPARGQSSNKGTAPGDAMPTLTEAAANLTGGGAGRIFISAGRYDIDESSLDYTFNHKAQCIIRGAGMRSGASGGTEINWKGGDGTRSVGTFSAAQGDTTINVITGTFPANAATGNTPGSPNDGTAANKLIRLAGAGYGGADLLTHVLTRPSGSQITILDPVQTAVAGPTGKAWTVYDPKFLWFMGSRTTAGTAWGAQGGLEDIAFNVDADKTVAAGTHRDNLVFIGVQNGQNGGWMNRIKVGDKNDDGTGSGVEKFRDGLFGIYAFSGDVAGKGAGGLGMNYLRDLWLFGGEYPLISGFSANPCVIFGGSSTGQYGRAQIYVLRAGAAVSNLVLSNWKTEMRDRYVTQVGGVYAYSYSTDFGNPEDANGCPFLIDIAAPKLQMTSDLLSGQQEAAGGHGGGSFTPTIPLVRYQPTDVDPPAISVDRAYATKFPNAFGAPFISPGTKYDIPFPGGSTHTRSVNFSFEKTLTAPWATTGTPSGTVYGAIEVRDDGIWARTSAGWKKATIS